MKLFFTVSFSVLFLSISVLAQPGELDLTFGGTGISKIGFDEGDDRGYATAMQSDGKIVAAGKTFNGQKYLFGVARYNPNGSLDTTFDTDGLASTEIADSDEAYAVTIQPDGKIVATGLSRSGAGLQLAVVRYNSDGSLDDTFDADGIVTFDLGGFAYGRAVKIDASDKILVGGVGFFSGEQNYAVLRFNPDGSLDNSFDSDGIAALDITPGQNDILRAVALQTDGKIVVCGDNDTTFQTVRFNPDGSIDTSFGNSGIVETNVSNNGSASVATSVTIDTFGVDHKIVVAGYSFSFTTGFNIAVVRYDLNGDLDFNFSSDGIVETSINNNSQFGHSVSIQPNDGKIVVAGSSYDGVSGNTIKNFVAVRYNDDGSLDSTFDSDGIAMTPVDSGDATAYGIGFKTGGKIVLVGHSSKISEDGSADDFTVVQYNSDGSLDTNFDTDGKAISPWSHFPSVARAIAIQSDGKLIVVGDSNNLFAVVRFNTNGTLDTSFGNYGKTRINFGGFSSAKAAVVQPDGKIVIVGSNIQQSLVDSNFAIARLNSNGSIDTTFDFDGLKTVSFGSQQDEANAVTISSTGNIFVGGMANVGFNLWDYGVISLFSNGSFDTGFDFDGKVTTNILGVSERINSIVIQPDGKIIAAGYAFTGIFDVSGAALNNFAVVRYNANGSLDTTFGTGGIVTTAISSNDSKSYSALLQPDGKIVVVGANRLNALAKLRFAIVRYNANGTLDNTFGTGGIVTTPVGVDESGAFTSAIQADGKIVVGGYASIFGTTTFYNKVYAIARYNPDGSLDAIVSRNEDSPNVWGTGGIALIDVSEGNDQAFGLQLDSQGRVVVVGETDGSFGVFRLQGNAVTAANASISGRVLISDGIGLKNAAVLLTDASGNRRTANTNSFGNYRFDEIESGQTVILTIVSKRFQFQPRVEFLNESLQDVDFIPIGGNNALK